MKGNGMKVRLVKKENLMKAANRANLVKVAVQVNGRTGQYSSHRWKNPNAALNVLKETMKRAGIKTTDELEFKSKKTKKVVDEEQLISDYKESKTTDTLQDFVKKNYTVSKANGEKINTKQSNKQKVANIAERVKQKAERIKGVEKFEVSSNGNGVSVESNGKDTFVSAPGDDEFAKRAKEIGGTWSAEKDAWSIPEDKQNELQDILFELYDWDDNDNIYMTVTYKTNALKAIGNKLKLGAMTIAERPKKDSEVIVNKNTKYSGEFPSSGGTAENPKVAAGNNMEFKTKLHKRYYEKLDQNTRKKQPSVAKRKNSSKNP